MNLVDLAVTLSASTSPSGASIHAQFQPESDTLRVVCDANPDAEIYIVASDEQIMAITPLFPVSDVPESSRLRLYETLLQISLLIPLSSVALQDGNVVLFGAMSVETSIKNIIHEIEVQADNYSETLAALAEFFETDKAPEEA